MEEIFLEYIRSIEDGSSNNANIFIDDEYGEEIRFCTGDKKAIVFIGNIWEENVNFWKIECVDGEDSIPSDNAFMLLDINPIYGIECDDKEAVIVSKVDDSYISSNLPLLDVAINKIRNTQVREDYFSV